MGRCTCTSATPWAPNVVWSVPAFMVSRIFWQAEDTGRAAGGVLEHRVKGGVYCLAMIIKVRSRHEWESAELYSLYRFRLWFTEIVCSTAVCEDYDCQQYITTNRIQDTINRDLDSRYSSNFRNIKDSSSTRDG